MGKLMIALVAFLFVLESNATSCGAGAKAKTTAKIGETLCSTDTKSCNSGTCCEADTDKCGGITDPCTGDKYRPLTKYGDAKGTTPATTCCVDKTACTAVTCKAGHKAKASGKCAGTATDSTCQSLASTGCCERDPTKCGGIDNPCAASVTYYDDTTAGTDKGDTPATTCCKAIPKCDAVTCLAAWKKKTTPAPATTTCLDSPTSSTCLGTCCEKDTDKCGGIANPCDAATHYHDTTKATTPKGTTPKTACCTAKATCQHFFDDAATSGAIPGMRPTAAAGFIIAALALPM